MLGTHLHLTLRSLCFNTEWKYAVFWKLSRRSRMMLTWEDAYYDHREEHSLEKKCFNEAVDNLPDRDYLRDPLGLAVAKMSYHVYSLGEGIVGKVAVTGQHQWILADKQANNFSTSLESSDGWLTQFSAGIRTVVVVAVVPHGVVQLGSFNKVSEDMKLVNHVKTVFYALQGSSVGYVPNPIPYSLGSSLSMPDVSTASSCSDIFQNGILNLHKSANNENSYILPSMLPSHVRDSNSCFSLQVPSVNQERAVEGIDKHIECELLASRDEDYSKLLSPRSETYVMESPKQLQMKLLNGRKNEEANVWSNRSVCQTDVPDPHSIFPMTTDVQNLVETYGANFANLPPGLFNSMLYDKVQCDGAVCGGRILQNPKPSNVQQQNELKIKLEQEADLSCIASLNTSLKYSVGSELHEVLGSAFIKPIMHHDWEPERIKAEANIDMPGGIGKSQAVSDFASDNLLDAVVANVCQSTSETKTERSFSQSMQSLLTTERMSEPLGSVKQTAGPASCSIDHPTFTEEDSKQCLTSSDVCGTKSPKGFSSTSPSACSEQLERSSEPVKTKKRARPGESCRPRPRDRQLIQDRIKELRELVPNGSKCSIDSLLERTIKHMLFMQSITKYADKLKECVESKLRDKDEGMLGSACDQGSSWAVEVGSHVKVCPIVVENINMSGQLLVEMLCEECGHFLEVAEAIKSLGLTILKGITEAHGEKTWICFVVEGQNNRTMHRMDVLWSLVQTLQPKTAA